MLVTGGARVWARRFVFGAVATVAIFDVSMGLYLLSGHAPELAHGTSAIWARAPELVASTDEGRQLLGSFFARLGAFSLHAGVSTLVWTALARDRPHAMTALLVTYTITGLAFFASDSRYFAGTPYFAVKQALGVLWTLALIVHVWTVRSAARAPVVMSRSRHDEGVREEAR